MWGWEGRYLCQASALSPSFRFLQGTCPQVPSTEEV